MRYDHDGPLRFPSLEDILKDLAVLDRTNVRDHIPAPLHNSSLDLFKPLLDERAWNGDEMYRILKILKTLDLVLRLVCPKS